MKTLIEFIVIIAVLVAGNAMEYYFGSNFFFNWDYFAGALTVMLIIELRKLS